MNMLNYIGRRLLLMAIVMAGVVVITFTISHMVPGDPLVANLGQSAMSNPEIVAAYEEKWGLNKPLPEQFILYVRNMFKGDLGTSIRTKRPVLYDLSVYFPATVEMATLATFISVVFGMLFGVISAARRNKAADQVLRAVSLVGISIPAFWLALLMLYVFYFRLNIAPGSGRLSLAFLSYKSETGFLILDAIKNGNMALLKDVLSHIAMPSIVLAASTMGLMTRTVRSSMLDVMGQDYLRTARAKGLTERQVIMNHALKNGLIPSVTMFGLSYGSLLGGTVLVETIFDYPGLGWYAYQSATTLDYPAIMGVTLVIALINCVMSLLIDIIYAFIDPRVRY
ncbi:MAG: ABC transporter permease [Firmicutes bacterium]|nr:ABC transporter permease [Bacillota bacterium]